MGIRIRHEADFERLIEALADDLVSANIHFKLHRDLRDSAKDYLRELNQSAAFWRLTFRAHLDTTLFALCRTYDQHVDSLSLPNWLDTIKENLSLFDIPNFKVRLKDNPFVESLAENVRKPDERQLENDLRFAGKSNPLTKKLIILRNNLFVHKSAEGVMFESDLIQTYPLTPEDIQQLLDTGMGILNRYTSLFRAQLYSTQIVGHDDYLYVLRTIKVDLERKDAELEAEEKRHSEREPGKAT